MVCIGGLLDTMTGSVILTASEVKEVESYIDQLNVENAKLREQVMRLQVDWESERDYADQMEAKEKMAVSENDKLRRLVGMMSKAIGVSATTCYGDCIAPYECSLDGGCPIQRLMRELEVEVNG